MTLIKKVLLATMATFIAAAFTGGPSASAETTALCKADEAPCASANQVSHVHEATLSGSKARLLTGSLPVNRISHVHEGTLSGKKARLLTSIGTVECDALFLGDEPESGPLEIVGNFTYTNCELGGSSCSAVEENGPAEIAGSGEGHETATATEEFLAHIVCGTSIDCSFSGIGLLGTVKGPLLSVQKNGEVVLLGQTVSKEVGGFLCPKTSKLDITTTPLEATYIIGEEKNISLCKEDGGLECPRGEGITVECDVLFLGDAAASLGNPLVVKGSFTYSNCNHECVATEENGPTEIKVLKEGHETTKVTGEGLIHLKCGTSIDCSYNGTNLIGKGTGPLLSTQANGEVTTNEATTTKETGGFLCPKTSKLDITTTPLSATYISS